MSSIMDKKESEWLGEDARIGCSSLDLKREAGSAASSARGYHVQGLAF